MRGRFSIIIFAVFGEFRMVGFPYGPGLGYFLERLGEIACMKSLDDIDLKGKRVFMRVDFNVPLDQEQRVTDDLRIRAVLPSIGKVLDTGGRLILASHLGRPKGKPVDAFSLKPVAEYLNGLLGRTVDFVHDCIGPEVKEAVSQLGNGELIILENLRFHPEEEKNDPEFSRQLAELCDVYVNEAFSASHRAHASVEGITHFVPVCAAGYQLRKELEYFEKALGNPERPLAIVIGGAKVSSKIGVLENIISRADYLIIGGAMANTFFKAQGKQVGKSLVEDDYIETAARLLESAKTKGVKVFLPVDAVVAVSKESCGDVRQVMIDKVPQDTQILDIGSQSIEVFESVLKNCKTVVWNGPMGVFETPPFNKGTFALAGFLGSLDALTVIGGGDSAAAVKQANMDDKVSYVSTGGGAFLELMEGIKLPGVTALEDCDR
jgi:phosphoglycerate kinase